MSQAIIKGKDGVWRQVEPEIDDTDESGRAVMPWDMPCECGRCETCLRRVTIRPTVRPRRRKGRLPPTREVEE